MNVNDIYETESTLLKAKDIPHGKEVPVVIASYDVIEMEGKKKILLKFVGKDKGLVLNKTNAGAIASAFGDDCDGWQTKTIYLYQTRVDYAGQMVDAIRVRPQLETALADDDIPF